MTYTEMICDVFDAVLSACAEFGVDAVSSHWASAGILLSVSKAGESLDEGTRVGLFKAINFRISRTPASMRFGYRVGLAVLEPSQAWWERERG